MSIVVPMIISYGHIKTVCEYNNTDNNRIRDYKINNKSNENIGTKLTLIMI